MRRSSLLKIERLVEAGGPGPWTRNDLLDLGWRGYDIDRALARGLLRRVRRGVYELPGAQEAAEQLAIPYDAQLARIQAVVRRLRPRVVVSHDSAAHVHGLWTPSRITTVVHVTDPGASERHEAGLHVHSSALPEEFVQTTSGVRVTTVARTAVDLALGRDLPAALVAADGALRRLTLAAVRHGAERLRDDAVPAETIEGLRAQLVAAAEVARGWPGTRVVHTAIAEADPHSESPYESWSRGWILAVGLPRPEANRRVVGASGRPYVGDLVWLEHGLIGEVDGVAKYGSTSAEIRRALREERARQADLEAAGWRFVRWVPGDSGAVIVARVGRALYLGRPRPAAAALGA